MVRSYPLHVCYNLSETIFRLYLRLVDIIIVITIPVEVPMFGSEMLVNLWMSACNNS